MLHITLCISINPEEQAWSNWLVPCLTEWPAILFWLRGVEKYVWTLLSASCAQKTAVRANGMLDYDVLFCALSLFSVKVS